jgi:hypothetical protein
MSKVFNKLLKTTTNSCKNIKKPPHIVIIYHKSKAVQALWNNCSVLQLMPQKALTAWRQPATLWLPGNATPAALPVSYKKSKGKAAPQGSHPRCLLPCSLAAGLVGQVRTLTGNTCCPMPQLHQAAPGCCQCSSASCCRLRCSQRPALTQLLPRPRPGCPGCLPLPGGHRPPRSPLILLETSYGRAAATPGRFLYKVRPHQAAAAATAPGLAVAPVKRQRQLPLPGRPHYMRPCHAQCRGRYPGRSSAASRASNFRTKKESHLKKAAKNFYIYFRKLLQNKYNYVIIYV